LQYLGIQEASRKRRPPTQSPGAWAGGVFRTSAISVYASVSQEKWDKAKTLVAALWKVMEDAGLESDGCDVSRLELDYKELEITRGFLVHLSMTFEMLTHHLKGFHLALASHLSGRDKEGWRISDAEWTTYLLAKADKGVISQEEVSNLLSKSHIKDQITPPKTVKIIPHLRDDIYALREFFTQSSPQEI
jgi:hypothetical protein